MDWKETVTSASDKIFPGLSQKIDNENKKEVLSNLPLQMALYLNVYFAPFWFGVTVIFLNDKFERYSEILKVLILTALTLVVIVELLRLYLGYEGNLRDQIPELASFWMLSVLLQLPLQAALLFCPYFQLSPIEIVVQSVMFLLLLAQIGTGFTALKYTARKHALYYRIEKQKRQQIAKSGSLTKPN